MNPKRAFPIRVVVAGLALLLILIAAGTPNLLRSRKAADQAGYTALRPDSRQAVWEEAPDAAGAKGGVTGRVLAATYSAEAGPPLAGRKVVQTATMDLVVADPRQAAGAMEDLARRCDGYVESSSLERDIEGRENGSIVLRVPADRFASVREQLRGLAVQVQKDQAEARDVTRQFVDYEAELRNDRAEEQQYLEIMKRSGTIKDTVLVAEKLVEVRGRIERLQGELQYLSHQVELATITVRYWKEPQVSEARFHWHPWLNARESWRTSAEALAGYADAMVSLLLYLPVILAWGVTVVALAYGAIRLLVAVGRWLLPKREQAAAPAR